MEEEHKASPSVVPRRTIPVSSGVGELEVRPFLGHDLLGSVISESDVALSWIEARAGQDIAPRSEAMPGLLIVLDGSAELVGTQNKTVRQGDVITLPEGQPYGFRQVGADGLHALHVMFRATSGALRANSATLERLLARNDARMQSAMSSPFFLLLQRGGFQESQRSATREVLRVFSDAFQTFLFTRQAMCRDEAYHGTFHTHLLEELGHNHLLKISGNQRIRRDPVLHATATWFCHQMLVLDNAGKSVVNMVLETAGYYFHTLAAPVFSGNEGERYFDTHAEDDEHHKDVGLELLAGQHPMTYRRLERVLEESWDMLDAMTRRFAYLIELETKSS